jgi:uncharacterized protein (DUF1330 family)
MRCLAGCITSIAESSFRYTQLAMVAGFGLGAVAVQSLHAQGKPKAYTISEIETLDAAAQAAYVPDILAAIKAAGGRNFNTAGGKIAAIVGEAPKRVAINEWDSLEQAQAFYKSKVWNDLAPKRDKAQKLIRAYAVEALK